MPALPLIALSLLLLLALAAVGVARARVRQAGGIVYGGTGLACALVGLAALGFLNGGAQVWTLPLPLGLPWQPMALTVDGLSAFFLVVVNLAGVTASLYGWGYGQAGHGGHGAEPGRVLPAFPLFLLGMNLVLLADGAFGFLLAWETMSVASWLLVLSTHREEGTPRAAHLYLVMASLGTLCLLLAFGLLAAGAGGQGFADLRAGRAEGWVLAAAVLLAIVGAGSKAGLVPLHVWLPLAHPAAPSHVSALMSGVMTKVAVYALVRILFDLAGPPGWWWGALLLALGALTAVAGVLYALFQDDTKRLLAYSTVENIGFVTLCLGLALLFKAEGVGGVAAVALAAALLHVLNHSLFKTLLFYGAGAVLVASGSRSLDRLGGLVRRMPVTAPLVLVGAGAASALPPLNGFASEWLGFQAILHGPQLSPFGLKVGAMVAGVAAALAAALAAACFLRFFGIAFLGRARSAEAAAATEANRPMLAAMAVPAVLCLAVGVLPGAFLGLAGGASDITVGARLAEGAGWLWLAPSTGAGFGGNSYAPVLVVLAGAGLAALAWKLLEARAPTRLRRAIPWGCGYPDPGPVAQYGGHGFAQPLRRLFGGTVFAARERVSMPEPGETQAAGYEASERDPAWDLLASPVARAAGRVADLLEWQRRLGIRENLALMVGLLVALLVLLVLLR